MINNYTRQILGHRTLITACLLGFILTSGCTQSTRPKLGAVHGKVALDGKPLKGAGVGFRPEGGGRESMGATDDEGNYTLNYIRDIQGAAVGWHIVRISTANPRAGRPELVPKQYNTESALRKEVIAGDNVIDFDLKSK
ncbi:MAG: carboxypeptidase regulatory-like domain-containing protein [Thermoguttaceae bacterium]|jgi:hypothetical protein